MTQIESIKPCATVTQKRVEPFLLRVHVEAKDIPLRKTCVTFTKKVV